MYNGPDRARSPQGPRRAQGDVQGKAQGPGEGTGEGPLTNSLKLYMAATGIQASGYLLADIPVPGGSFF